MRHIEKTITAVAHESTPPLQAFTAVDSQPTSWTQSDFFFGCVLSYFPFLGGFLSYLTSLPSGMKFRCGDIRELEQLSTLAMARSALCELKVNCSCHNFHIV